MKKNFLFIILAIFVAACGHKKDPYSGNKNGRIFLNTAANERGDLVRVEKMSSLSAKEIVDHIDNVAQDKVHSKPLLNEMFKNRSAENGVHLYKIVYKTIDPKNRLIDASGLLILPNLGNSSYPLVSIQHATIGADFQAPTNSPFEGLFEGAHGFAVAVNDYIGYGEAQSSVHPYLIMDGYAKPGVDFLRAIFKFTEESLKIDLKGDLFLKGYSEGGFATLALQYELERINSEKHEFNLVASAPSAGPYTLSEAINLFMGKIKKNHELDEMNDQVTKRKTVHSSLISKVFRSYVEYYDLGKLDDEYVNQSNWKQYVEGFHTLDEIDENIPSMEFFNPEFVSLLHGATTFSGSPLSMYAMNQECFKSNDPSCDLYKLIKNDIENYENEYLKVLLSKVHSNSNMFLFAQNQWQPKTKTRFYHCQGDKLIEPTTTAITMDMMHIFGYRIDPEKLEKFYIMEFHNKKEIYSELPHLESSSVNPNIEFLIERPLDEKLVHQNCPAVYSPTLWFKDLLNQRK